MSRNRKPSIDPVILIALGIVFLTIAIVMIVFQSKGYGVNIASNSGTMSQLVVAFVTGLTTGGLSCLAVQGGDDALKLQRSPQDQLYGDRDGCIIDRFGHGWIISTHVEDVEPAEMTRPMAG